ncbi:hypothetical protein LCGC14_0752820 [marine sediment metagenome]|uniref:Uncharacterized protein n=1 Tax=marine sediment metagenome TaxID=412755 RepID=A0A0F9TAG4_9ZZZZ
MTSSAAVRGQHNMGAFEFRDGGPNMGALEDIWAFGVSVDLTVAVALTAVLSVAPAYTAELSVTPLYTARIGVSNVST